MSDKKLLPFVPCEHPVELTDAYGNPFKVPCGHCSCCLRNKVDVHSLKLQLEERNHRFNEFITLTYDEQHVPRYRVEFEQLDSSKYVGDVEQLPFSPNFANDAFSGSDSEFLEHAHNIAYDFTDPYFDLESAINDGMSIEDKAPEVPNIRQVIKAVPIFERPDDKVKPTIQFLDVHDQKYKDIDAFDAFKQSYDRYYKRRCFYVKKYSKTSFHQRYLEFDGLYKRDLELFMYQLRNYAKRECSGATLRFYAVGEYGSNSLRPHWHIICSHDSIELHRAFSDTENYGTAKRPSFGAKFVHSLWNKGIVNTSRVAKSCASYVSGYVLSSISVPRFLDQSGFRAKAYHSIHLGEVLSQETILDAIRNQAFDALTGIRGYDYKGREFTYDIWRSNIRAYLPVYSYVDTRDIDALCQVHWCVSWLMNRYSYLFKTYRELARWLYLRLVTYYRDGILYDVPEFALKLLYPYYIAQTHALHLTEYNVLYTLLLRCSAINRCSSMLNLSIRHFFETVRAYEEYIARTALRKHYQQCESTVERDCFGEYSEYVLNYYEILEHNNYDCYEYKRYIYDVTERNAKWLKHADTADKYRMFDSDNTLSDILNNNN